MKHLPRKPSRLIRLSLKDLAEREADPRYTICMGGWHETFDQKCYVCLAGATMARLGVRPTRHCDPSAFDKNNRHKLYALNCFRNGNVEGALQELHLERPKGIQRRVHIPSYACDRDGFFTKLNRLADRLEKVGL
jgi:hypothetical protein